MIRFAWWSLRGRWTRILPLCLGLICISICTTLLGGLAQLSTLTTDWQLNHAWQLAPYDLLVRSSAALSPVERQLQIVDPAGPEQTYGGISLKQLDTIAQIPHVAVAAPEAVVGWIMLRPYLLVTFPGTGLYRVTTQLIEPGQRNGPSATTQIQNVFDVLPLSAYRVAGKRQNTPEFTYVPLNASGKATIAAYWPLPTLLVGIDPGSEARLVGLRWQPSTTTSGGAAGIPILMDTHPWAPFVATVRTERGDLAGLGNLAGASRATRATACCTTPSFDRNVVARVAGLAPARSTPPVSWSVMAQQQFDNHELLSLLAQELSTQDAQASNVPLQGGGVTRYARVDYELPPQSGNASLELNLLSAGADADGLLTRLPLLPQVTAPWISLGSGRGSFDTFDAAKLPLLRNSDVLSAPLGLYQPQPSEEAAGLFPQHSIVSSPPLLFTTMQAACSLIGEQCISAIRVRVARPATFSQQSEALVQQVAADISRRTGLHVDVLTGASGRQVMVQSSPDSKSSPAFSEVWISPHAAVTIANGVSSANVLLLVSETAVAALALIAAALLSTNSRRGDLTLLSRLGWSNRRILVESLLEAVVTALLAALPAWLLSLLLERFGLPAISPAFAFYALAIAGLLYITIGVVATRTMVIGREKSARSERRALSTVPWWLRMLFRQISWYRGSAALVAISVAGACGLVFLLLLVYWGLNGLLYTTLLGQQVQVELSGIHLVTALLTCASAVLAAGLTILLMVRERRREFGMLLAIGWTSHGVALEVVREGIALGVLGGLCGGMASILVFLAAYHTWSLFLFAGCLCGSMALGMVLCVLGAIYPALLAAQLSPRQVFASA